ncbi:FtsX-like permease family protein [candidate division GN15 bacterium]|nr:FtsX-like permease family protein [candidate division GN15 bacterium]
MVGVAILGIAFGALLANKLRSGLTLLGVIFGVTSVMTIISAVEGMTGAIEENLKALGPSTFMVGKMMITTSHEEWREKMKRQPIEMDHYEAIIEQCRSCEEVSPRTYTMTDLKHGAEEIREVGVMGGKANFIKIIDMEIAQGRFHSAEDDFYKRQVAFIGDDIREEFFSGVDPLGKEFKIGNRKYTVIGVAKARGSTFGESEDKFVVIPLSVFHQQFGKRQRGLMLMVKSTSVGNIDYTMDEVRMILRSQRQVPYDEPDDFDMLTAESAMDLFNQLTRFFRMTLIGISSISLVVGGIVVMNIMMVSVTERTREIGIRKSLGARRSHILLQFLYEALLLTLSGGIVGIILGFIIARALVGMIDMDISPSALAIFSGLFISTGTGLIFGIYPAMKASRLDPVKALSYE